MSNRNRNKKSGSKKPLTTEYILLATAIIKLIEVMMEFIRELIE